jgi:hypothetical protein
MDMFANGAAAVSPGGFLILGVVAFLGAILGGVSSFGAGLIVTPFLIPVVGVKGVVPLMSIAMVFGNLSRFWVYRDQVDRDVVLKIMVPALPGVIAGTLLYGYLPQRALAVLIGVFLLASIPLRRILAKRAVTPTAGAVVGFSGIFGLVSGALPGGGVVLMPLLLGLGLVRGAVVGTDAVIGTAVNLLKIGMFGKLDLIDQNLLVAGVLVGLCMVPAAYGARWLIARLHVKVHTALIEVLVVFSGFSFIWSALTATGADS